MATAGKAVSLLFSLPIQRNEIQSADPVICKRVSGSAGKGSITSFLLANPKRKEAKEKDWCPGEDSNLHGLLH